MRTTSLAVAAALMAVGATVAAQPITVRAPARPVADFTQVIRSVSPAVVSVTATVTGPQTESALLDRFRNMPELDQFLPDLEEFMRRRRGPRAPQQGQSSGSGFFISPEGHIVTNHHVVRNADGAKVKLHDGREFEARVIGSDQQTDLAVLKVELDKPAPYVRFANGDSVEVGQWVVAVGNPFNFGGTATVGIVSALGREIGGVYADFIQIDASINRGNSGGPTFSLSGEVIGVNTAIVSPTGGSVGIGFAIEGAAASRIVSKLMESGAVSRGWLGVSIQSVTETIAEARGLASREGAIVSEVIAGSPAEQSGFRRGDIITAVDGAEIEDSRELTRRVGALNEGSKVRFAVLRDGRTRVLNVTIGKRPDNPLQAQDNDAPAVLGASLSPVDEQDRKRLSLRKRDRGVVVSSLQPDSPLAKAGIAIGDAMLEANGRILGSQDDFEDALTRARDLGRSNLLVAVRKGGRTLYLAIGLGEE